MSYLQTDAKRKKIRVPDLRARKTNGNTAPLITSLTCYDATFARLLEHTSVDLVLVGDSLGHVVQGRSSTIGVTIDDIAYHVRCVASRLKTPLLVADVPFGSVGFSDDVTYQHAQKLMTAGAEAVKIEGATDEVLRQISCLVRHGIPVLGHIGLMPQSVNTVGGYRVQGKSISDQERLKAEAHALEKAGCFGIVLELVDPQSAAAVTKSVGIPTIGIGSGHDCDGQVLVLHDMLGLNLDFAPKFLKHFAELEKNVVDAVTNYCNEVSTRTYPK